MIEKNKNREVKIFLICIFISLLLIFIDKKGWLNVVKRPFEKLGNPLREKIYNFTLKTPKTNKQLQTSEDINLLEKLRDELERENASLKVENKNLKQENDNLRKQIQAPLPSEWKFIPAKVLNIEKGILSINQGSDVGIKEGQVAVFENILIGKVIQVTPRTAKIILPSHKESQIKAKIVENNSKGLVKCERDNQIVFSDVLQEVEMNKDQIVVTSGEEGVYPADLLIAKIDKIQREETAIYQTAILRTLIDYSSINNIFVIQ